MCYSIKPLSIQSRSEALRVENAVRFILNIHVIKEHLGQDNQL